MATLAQSPRDVEAQVAPQAPPSPGFVAANSASTMDSCSTGSASQGKQRQSGCLGALCDLLTPAQKLYCGFALLVELLLIWLSQETVTAEPANDQWVYTIAHLMLVSLYPRAPAASPVTTQPATAAGVQRAPGAAAAGGTGRARAFFLDGVKILCTELVLIHHITIGFGGNGGLGFALQLGLSDSNTQGGFGGNMGCWLLTPDQSFFMCLLFFVAGIFTPSSLERKGVAEFVRDKLQRLGWPLVVTYFVVSPLSAAFRRAVLVGGDDLLSDVWFGTGVTWFLETLLIFSISYAILPFPQVSVPMPSVAQVLLACVVLGAVQGWVSYCDFALLGAGPQMQGGLPFDVAFFAAGCLAKRSGWLEGVQGMAPRDFWLARLAALVTVVGTGLGSDWLFGLPPTPGCVVLRSAWFGAMTGGMSVSVIHFFAVHCNSPGRWQSLAGQSQYAVYVLQAVVIPGVMLTLLPILRAAGYPVEFYSFTRLRASGFEVGPGFYSWTDLPQGVIVGGWLYTIVLVTLISWPLGYFFRKLPLVRDVL